MQNSYSPAFPLKHQQKDMRLALTLGDENAVSMPVAAAANEVVLFVTQISFDAYSNLVHIVYQQVHGKRNIPNFLYEFKIKKIQILDNNKYIEQ